MARSAFPLRAPAALCRWELRRLSAGVWRAEGAAAAPGARGEGAGAAPGRQGCGRGFAWLGSCWGERSPCHSQSSYSGAGIKGLLQMPARRLCKKAWHRHFLTSGKEEIVCHFFSWEFNLNRWW